jgi:two-component system, sensor histidine kinase and response regulator
MARVLVVDDEESIRETLGIFLRKAGYEVVLAEDVPTAQQRLKETEFDVVVTDIIMPRLTGVELLQMIRQQSPRVQVILMTGQPTVETAAATVRAGAFDYLTKPIIKEDILRRVGNAAKLKTTEDERARLVEADRRQKAELEENYNRLRQLESMRDSLVHMIIHDLRSPLAGMLGYLDVFKTKTTSKLSASEGNILNVIQQNADKMMMLVLAALDVNRLESGQMPLNRQAYDLTSLAKTIMESLGSLARQKHINLEAPSEPVMVKADKDVVERIITNLLANALKFTPEFGDVHIIVSLEGPSARLTVKDTGPGIPAEYHTKIFEKFGAIDKGAHGYSTGLGLAFCKLAVEAHDGQIGVQSEVDKGSAFWFTLPTT